MKTKDEFIRIFTGLQRAYGQTLSKSRNEAGKIEGKSWIVPEQITEKNWITHLKGEEPSLGIIPINENNECTWGAIDIDTYAGFDHKKLVKKIVEKKLPLVVCNSKSGGAHVYLFVSEPVRAKEMQVKLKEIAVFLGFGDCEIFPKQIQLNQKGTGNFLNLPYNNPKYPTRYAFDDEGNSLELEEFINYYKEKVVSNLNMVVIEKNIDDQLKEDFKQAPPCLTTIAMQGFGEGSRNESMFQLGIYLRERFPKELEAKMDEYNTKYMKPPCNSQEMVKTIASVGNKDYQYKCKNEPIVSFCNAKKCVTREFGVGDEGPVPEITELRKFDSDPPIYFVSIGGESVEVEDATLHDPEKFSLACMNQIGKPMMPVPKHSWRKLLIKLFKNLETIPAPPSSKIDVQLTETLADYINKTPGKEMKDVLRGISYTNREGQTFFKFKNFWKFLLRTKSWPDKTYPKQKTIRLMETLFNVTEETPKIGTKTERLLVMPTIKLTRPNPRVNKKEKEPWE